MTASPKRAAWWDGKARMRTLAAGSMPSWAISWAALALASLAAPAAAADQLNVALDQATITQLPERVSTIVVGNPLIADVSVQSGGLLVITGKGYGVTNIIAFDRNGGMLMETKVRVRGPSESVVIVYRGVERESYSCMPYCERRLTLGDTPEFFDAALKQSGSRIGQAQGAQGQSVQR